MQVLKAPLILSASVMRYVIENDMTIAYFYSEERTPIFVKPVVLADTEFNVRDLQVEVSWKQVSTRHKFMPELYQYVRDDISKIGVWNKSTAVVPNILKYVFQISVPETDLDIEYVEWFNVRPNKAKAIRDLRRVENTRQPKDDFTTTHKYQLRPDFQVTLTVPTDITPEEAHKLLKQLTVYLG
jgi:hypothetical protein